MTTIRPFPKLGLTLEGILHFIDLAGGRKKLLTLTTTEVSDKILKPLTQDCSFCDFLNSKGYQRYVGKPNVFISHAWGYNFLTVVDTLVDYKAKNDGALFWFDLFSNNQHFNGDLNFEWWCETFQGAIRDIGKVLMILLPWSKPITLTRAWCLWEVYCSYKVGKECFQVAFVPSESENIFEQLSNNIDKFYDVLSNIDVRKSQATNPTDLKNIMDAIDKSVGCFELNRLAISCVQDALLSHFTAIVENSLTVLQSVGKASQEVITSKSEKLIPAFLCLGKLMNKVGKFAEAKSRFNLIFYLFDYLPASEELRFESAIGFADACLGLGTNRDYQDMYFAFHALWQEFNRNHIHDSLVVHWRRRFAAELLKRPTPAGLRAARYIAKLPISQRQFDEPHLFGKELVTSVLQSQHKLLGSDNPDVIATVEQLALLHFSRMDYQRAVELYSTVKEYLLALPEIGQSHIRVLEIENKIAVCYIKTNKFSDGVKILERNCISLGEKFGRDNSLLIETRYWIAEGTFRLGGYDNCSKAYKASEDLLQLLKQQEELRRADIAQDQQQKADDRSLNTQQDVIYLKVKTLQFRTSYSLSSCCFSIKGHPDDGITSFGIPDNWSSIDLLCGYLLFNNNGVFYSTALCCRPCLMGFDDIKCLDRMEVCSNVCNCCCIYPWLPDSMTCQIPCLLKYSPQFRLANTECMLGYAQCAECWLCPCLCFCGSCCCYSYQKLSDVELTSKYGKFYCIYGCLRTVFPCCGKECAQANIQLYDACRK